MSARAPRVVIIGGGVTGLSAAYYLHRARPEVAITLLENRERLGGNIVTEQRDGFVIDGGPDSFLRTKPHGVELCKALGLESDFITTRPEGRSVYMVHSGLLERMPGGMVLAVPTRLGPMLKTPVLSASAKLRMLGDLLLPRGFGRNAKSADGDESIAEFLSRRFGSEAAERIGGPLLGGIYAGDIKRLSMRATFPQLIELEERHGSVVLGMFAAQASQQGEKLKARSRLEALQEAKEWLKRDAERVAPSPFVSLRAGMGSLIARLAAALPRGSVRTGCEVLGLRHEFGRWLVELRGEQIEADAVICAAPAHVAARIVPSARLREELSAIEYLSTATVFFALDRCQVAHPLDGLGFVVPPGEAGILAGTWVSSKWDGRAPDNAVLVRAFLGGARGDVDVVREDDASLIEIARYELERLMGPLGRAHFARVFRYIKANPQPGVGHPARLHRIDAELEQMPGLLLAGAAYHGVGIPDCVRQAHKAAERVASLLK